jgi:hypothetical protein
MVNRKARNISKQKKKHIEISITIGMGCSYVDSQ